MLALFIDEDYMRRSLVRNIRAGGIDVLTTAEAGRRGAPDDQQLEFAAAQGRTVYSCNLGDFARIYAN